MSSLQFAQLAGITTPVHAVRQPTAAAAPRPVARAVASPAPSHEDRQAFRAGVAQERRRWMAVLGSTAFGASPVAGAHMLANTSMDASAILSVLRGIAADNQAAPGARQAVIADRWSAAFQRMDASAATGSPSPRQSQEADRWSAAMNRAGIT
jgi:hypothetical protein